MVSGYSYKSAAALLYKVKKVQPLPSLFPLLLLPLNMQQIQALYKELQHPRKVVITTHQKPDPDAMGSSLGLYHLLTQLGHTVQVISPTNWASFLDWMPGCEKVIDFERNVQKCEKLLFEADWVFCLDFNALNRIKRMTDVLANAKAERILIDHHREPQTEVFAYGISNTAKSSTCEMIYDFICESGHADKINASIMQCLMIDMISSVCILVYKHRALQGCTVDKIAF